MPPCISEHDTTATAPSRCSGMETASIVVFLLAILFGIGALASAVVAWSEDDDDYYEYNHDRFKGAWTAAWVLFVICEILGLIAIPLAFVAARTYLRDRNALGVRPGPCLQGWHTAAWILYGILFVCGVAIVINGARGRYVAPGLIAIFLVVLAIGWVSC